MEYETVTSDSLHKNEVQKKYSGVTCSQKVIIEDSRSSSLALKKMINGIYGAGHCLQTASTSKVIQMEKIPWTTMWDIILKVPFGGTETKKELYSPSREFLRIRNSENIWLFDDFASRAQYLLNKAETENWNDELYNSVLLSCAIDCVAEAIAHTSAVNMPGKTSEIALYLTRVFVNELSLTSSIVFNEKKMNKNTIDSFPLLIHRVSMMSGIDPITLYLKNILSLFDAAYEIKEMALRSGIEPGLMLDMLYARFMSRLCAYKNNSDARDLPKVTIDAAQVEYSPKEFVGNISRSFAEENFQLPLVELRKCVGLPLDELQEQQDKEIDAHESEYKNVVTSFIDQYIQIPEKKENAITTLEHYLRSLPIQVTVNASDWFNKDGFKAGSLYQSMPAHMRRNASLKKIIHSDLKPNDGPSIELADWSNPNLLRGRGPGYISMRMDKDSMAEKRLLKMSEIPVFGSLCYGTDLQNHSGPLSQYGNLHFRLSGNAVCVKGYRAATQAPQCKNLIELFAQIINYGNTPLAAYLLGSALGCKFTEKISNYPNIEVILEPFDVQDCVDSILCSKSVDAKVKEGIQKIHKTIIEDEEDVGEPFSGRTLIELRNWRL
ncbi:hypothetical protein [Bacteroides sp.]|uniref:hypothetical protein n=1 Tax=Bacteroides sp. TaxID=29523 RepID=UPI00261C88B9|nr:hypothetical protein [Bacteroides sp.]